MPIVVRRIPKVHEDGLGVADMEEAVRLRRETGVYDALRCGEVLLPQMRVDLGVLAHFVEMPQEALGEH